MLLGTPVSAGWVDKAAARIAAQLGKAGFGEAMIAALAAEDVLAADETPVNVLGKTAPVPVPEKTGEADWEEKGGKAAAGAPHVLITRTPDGRLTFLQAIASRRKDAIAAACGPVHRLPDHRRLHRLPAPPVQAGRHQQCAQHVIRRCRAVTKLGPGGLQNWAGNIITILRDAHQAVEAARARGDTALARELLDDLENATTPRSRPGSSTTGCGTGTTGTTPDTRSGPGCATIRSRSSCSPANSP